MQIQNVARRLARFTAASLGAALFLTSSASANSSPYDGTGVIVQGPNCMLYQDDLTGQLYNNADVGGYGVFNVGDHVRIVAEQYPCFFPSCSSNACINQITLIEAYNSGNDPTTPFCVGDGSTTACPCGNNSVLGAGEGCANSSGSGALLTASGSDLVADDNLVLHVVQGRANQPCVFVQGATQIETPFRDGLLCMGNPTDRLELGFLDATGAVDSTTSLAGAGGATPGQELHYQVWYRDPTISPCGSGSNLTNAVSLTWQ